MLKPVYYEPARDVQNELVVMEMENVKASPHFHRCIEMLFVKDGEVEISSGNRKKVFKKGEIAFIRLYGVHSAYGTDSLSDTLMIPERYFSDAAAKNDLSFFILDDAEYNKKLFDIENEIKKREGTSRDYMMKGLVSVLLGLIAERYAPTESSPSETRLIAEIISYLDDNFNKEVTVEKTAERFGFSRYYFSRLFNRLFQCNFTVYLNRIRVGYVMKNEGKGKSKTELIYEAGFGCASAYYQFLAREKENNRL